MKIVDAVEKIKQFYQGTNPDGTMIDAITTRDQYLYGAPDQLCTGIVTTCFASVEVIQGAIEKGANLIICHEALFWNHGDKTDWLAENNIFQLKKSLLDQHQIVVWRNHDYIHSGFLKDDLYVDGIFYGVMDKLGWKEYLVGDRAMPMAFKIPKVSAQQLAQYLVEKFELNGLRLIGDTDMDVENVRIPFHILGRDNETIIETDTNQVDALLALEVVDFTVSEFVRDASQLGHPKIIYSIGHFNLEEPGMEYMLTYLPEIVGSDLPCYFIRSGDSFQYYQA